MIEEEPGIRIGPDLGAMLHRLRQDVRPQLAHKARGQGFFKEKPDVTTIARARPFRNHGQFNPAAGFEKRTRNFLPTRTIKIRRQQETGFIAKHGIDVHDKIAAEIVPPGKMLADELIGDWKQAVHLIRGFPHTPVTPFVGASWRATGVSRLSALELAGKYLGWAAEQRLEQFDLGGGWRRLCHHGCHRSRKAKHR